MTRQPFRVWVLASPPSPDVSTLPTVSGMHILRPAVFHRQRRQTVRLKARKKNCKHFWCKHQAVCDVSTVSVGDRTVSVGDCTVSGRRLHMTKRLNKVRNVTLAGKKSYAAVWEPDVNSAFKRC